MPDLSKTYILIGLCVVVIGTITGTVFSSVNAIQIIGFGSLVSVALVGMLRAEKTAEKVEEVRKTAVITAEKADIAATKVAEVKQTLQETTVETKAILSGLVTVTDRTEKYCNSAMGRALRLTATTARAKADITHDPVDIVAADLAEKEMADHTSKQAEIDAGAVGVKIAADAAAVAAVAAVAAKLSASTTDARNEAESAKTLKKDGTP